MKRKDYERLLEPMQEELVGMARWLKQTGARVVVLFEGRDTAGKGGAIGAISERLNPRQCHVVALGTPTDRERGEWYFQRYVQHLPTAGEIALFDRSWYNRAGVEKVMGFATEDQVTQFLAQVPTFEKMLIDDGIYLLKYWLATGQAQQEERLRERLDDPLKRWKLSPIDLAARERYEDYTEARERMFDATHTDWAPWTLLDFNDQKQGRLTLIRDLLDRLPDTMVPLPEITFPPLGHTPLVERYGTLKPLPDFTG